MRGGVRRMCHDRPCMGSNHEIDCGDPLFALSQKRRGDGREEQKVVTRQPGVGRRS